MTVALTEWRAHRSGSSTVDELVRVLAVEQRDANVFTGHSTTLPQQRVFGGQILAQCAVAATHTVEPPSMLHSMHAYFVRPGRPSDELRFEVATIRTGRSFATRRVDVTQDGELTCSMVASFHAEEDGLAHQDAMPVRTPPSELVGRLPFHLSANGPARAGAVELRGVPPEPDVPPRAESAIWMRVTAPLLDDPLLHRALLVYLSDFGVLHGAFHLHGVPRTEMRSASLDHSMWLHRPARADDWLLYETRSPVSGRGRALGMATMFTATGDLVATATQEMMVRLRDGPI